MKLTKDELTWALQRIAHELHTQDNRITSDPIFCVQERIRKRKDMGKSGETWVSVQYFLTMQSAQAYIDGKSYRHYGPLRLYVESGYENWEWQAIRQHLMEMFPEEAARAAVEEMCK